MIALKADIWGLNVLKDELKELYEEYQRAAGTLGYKRATAYRDEICRRIREQVDLSGEQLRRLGKLRVIQKAKSAAGEPYYAPYRASRGGTRTLKSGAQFSLRTDAEQCKPENVTKTLMATGRLSNPMEYIIRISERRGHIRAMLLPPRGRGPVLAALYKKYWYGPTFGTNPEMRDAWVDDWKVKTEELLAKLKAAVEAQSKRPPAMKE
jgi:hypothetical protein